MIALEERVASLSVSDDATAAKDEVKKHERRLMAELGICFTELQNMVNLCIQRSRGEQLDLAVLLGARGRSLGLVGNV